MAKHPTILDITNRGRQAGHNYPYRDVATVSSVNITGVDYEVTQRNYTILVNTNASIGITISMPLIILNNINNGNSQNYTSIAGLQIDEVTTGRTFVIKKNSSVGKIDIIPYSTSPAQTIDGSSVLTLSNSFESVMLQAFATASGGVWLNLSKTTAVGSSQFLSLPVPKISLTSARTFPESFVQQSITISSIDQSSIQYPGRNQSDTYPSATQSYLLSQPILDTMDLTDYHFEDPNKPIFLEMLHYSQKRRGRTDKFQKSGWRVAPTYYVTHQGPNPSLPWGTNFWTRGGLQTYFSQPFDGLNGTYSLPVDRPNHFQITSYTYSRHDIYQYLNGRFKMYPVAYRSLSAVYNPSPNPWDYLKTLVPCGRVKNWNQPTNRFGYSTYYRPLYISFRYIQWIPTANNGLGQIVSGPMSPIIAVGGFNFPFIQDPINSAQEAKPIVYINQDWTTPDLLALPYNSITSTHMIENSAHLLNCSWGQKNMGR